MRDARTEKSPGAGQQRIHLEQAAAAPPRFGQRLIRQRERGPTVVATEQVSCASDAI